MTDLAFQLHRRSLLTLGGSAAALAILGLAPVRALASSPVRFVVTDSRHPQSIAFARQWAASTPLQVTDGLTRLWREALLPHWQSDAPGTVVGMTTREVWACLAEQARSHGVRSTASPSHSLVSWVIG
jgi:hypothetical protein